MLNFVGFINSTWGADAATKALMLADFCAQYGYQEFVDDPANPGEQIPNPVTRTEFANYHITLYIVQTVNAARWKAGRDAVVIEELILE